MSVFTMVAVIVVTTTLGTLIGRWLKLREKALAQGPQHAALLAEVQELRERVAVLERIVTEPAYDLKRQIHALETPRRAA